MLLVDSFKQMVKEIFLELIYTNAEKLLEAEQINMERFYDIIDSRTR